MTEVKGIDITPYQDGGVLKEIFVEGTGDEKPFVGDNVSVHYTGTLLDGTKFDSSRDRGEKFKFDIGKGSVIKGWDIGIATMKRNEQARFIIRSDYGYGDMGSGGTIPPKATLVFDVELFDFHGDDVSKNNDQGVLRRIVKSGEGFSTPNEFARVNVQLKGLYEGRLFDERELEFEIGDGEQYDVISGVEQGLEKFKKGEASRLQIKSKYAWGKNGNEKYGIPPNADVVYEVALNNFEKSKEAWQLNGKEKLEQCELFKSKGTELFKQNKYEMALKRYSKIVSYLEKETYLEEDDNAKAKQLQVAANLNIAMCNLKLCENQKTIEACDEVLKLDANNEKALFRKAQAQLNEGNFEDSIRSFGRVIEINDANKEARAQLAVVRQKQKEHSEKEKKLYSKMFSAISKPSSSNVSTATNHADYVDNSNDDAARQP